MNISNPEISNEELLKMVKLAKERSLICEDPQPMTNLQILRSQLDNLPDNVQTELKTPQSLRFVPQSSKNSLFDITFQAITRG